MRCRYIRPARTEPSGRRMPPETGNCKCRWADLGKAEELPTDRKRAFHERAAARVFPREIAVVEGRDPQGIEADPANAAGRERQSSRSRRPGLLRNRPRHRAARPRPPAQADL